MIGPKTQRLYRSSRSNEKVDALNAWRCPETLHWAGRDGVRPASAPFPTLSLALRPQHLTPIQGYATPPHAHTGMVLLSQHSTRTRILDAVP